MSYYSDMWVIPLYVKAKSLFDEGWQEEITKQNCSVQKTKIENVSQINYDKNRRGKNVRKQWWFYFEKRTKILGPTTAVMNESSYSWGRKTTKQTPTIVLKAGTIILLMKVICGQKLWWFCLFVYCLFFGGFHSLSIL